MGPPFSRRIGSDEAKTCFGNGAESRVAVRSEDKEGWEVPSDEPIDLPHMHRLYVPDSQVRTPAPADFTLTIDPRKPSRLKARFLPPPFFMYALTALPRKVRLTEVMKQYPSITELDTRFPVLRCC
ncbi:hypothetical protein FB45DRAFT_1039165 [Roridomyces roridus]|uniref:Uncharacterized protein n=1 Tax=Roridomyces roridus TaxID=1738132 RepID=A0AAD7B2P2_9AGAR|nr:hypothetical protein FB45DRAFT_1039165 [Roridomyces roridus]